MSESPGERIVREWLNTQGAGVNTADMAAGCGLILASAIDAARAALAEAKAALQWYASALYWTTGNHVPHCDCADCDGGRRARAIVGEEK